MAQVFFLPIFGVTIWLLMSAFAHVALRLAGKSSDFDLVLNIVGMGMLIPMAVTWAWDIHDCFALVCAARHGDQPFDHSAVGGEH